MAAGGHFVKKKSQKKVAYRSEVARNAIESEFRTSKMADRSEMARNTIESAFRTSKMAAEKQILYRSEMAKIAIESEISDIQNGRSILNGQKCNGK